MKKDDDYNYIEGVDCRFNFYVVAFDTKNSYQTYGEMKADLSLSQARDEYKTAIKQNPKHVNTMLGVSFITERNDIEPQGMGALDLLQHIDGHTKLTEDYLHHPILCNEGLIALNTINILKKDIESINEAEKSEQTSTVKENDSLLGKLRLNEAAVKNRNESEANLEF